MGSAQAFYAVVAGGVILGLVGLASGALYADYGGAVYFLAAAVALIGCGAGLAVLKGWSGGPLLPDPPCAS
jgi:hypothetical protein